MASGGLKTAPRAADALDFIRRLKDPGRRKDCLTLLRIMKEATGAAPVMWGPSIVGFGKYHFRYESGREGDWFLTGFSPRARNLTIYVMPGVRSYPELLGNIGTHSTGVSCLYVKSVDAIDTAVLKRLIRRSVADMKKLSKRQTNSMRTGGWT